MFKLYFAAQVLSMSAFVLYGISCMFSQKMVLEFERYGLQQFRFLTGALQVLGALGLFVGFYISVFTSLASLGLAAQMFLGVIVRLRIKDSFLQIIPALFFCILNSWIFYLSLSIE